MATIIYLHATVPSWAAEQGKGREWICEQISQKKKKKREIFIFYFYSNTGRKDTGEAWIHGQLASRKFPPWGADERWCQDISPSALGVFPMWLNPLWGSSSHCLKVLGSGGTTSSRRLFSLGGGRSFLLMWTSTLSQLLSFSFSSSINCTTNSLY